MESLEEELECRNGLLEQEKKKKFGIQGISRTGKVQSSTKLRITTRVYFRIDLR